MVAGALVQSGLFGLGRLLGGPLLWGLLLILIVGSATNQVVALFRTQWWLWVVVGLVVLRWRRS